MTNFSLARLCHGMVKPSSRIGTRSRANENRTNIQPAGGAWAFICAHRSKRPVCRLEFGSVNDGWIKLHRALLDHPRSKNASWISVWLHLLLMATHKPIRMIFDGKVIDLKPGQLITSRPSLSASTGVHRSSVDRILQTMIFEQQIEQQTSNVSRLITILNWSKYQISEQQTEHPASNGRATGEQPASTNKNVKKEENVRIPPLPPEGNGDFHLIPDAELSPQEKLNQKAIEVLSYLNVRTKQRFRMVESHLSAIRLRLAEVNEDVAGIKKMIDMKAVDSLGTENERYLNPETLFRPKNFNRWYDQRNSADRTIPIPGTYNP